ncbi:hypothetical protein NL676_012299 [Syzygium grande]|nr:hypothetical protein NL676_012299 [Syzygium grande]
MQGLTILINGFVPFACMRLAFLVLSLLYKLPLRPLLHCLPSLGLIGEPTVFIPRDWVRHLCILTATAVVLCLSIACNFDSIYEGSKEGTAAATPHLFLLASQVMEGMAYSSRFSSLIVKRRREKFLFDFRGLRS